MGGGERGGEGLFARGGGVVHGGGIRRRAPGVERGYLRAGEGWEGRGRCGCGWPAGNGAGVVGGGE